MIYCHDAQDKWISLYGPGVLKYLEKTKTILKATNSETNDSPDDEEEEEDDVDDQVRSVL